MIYCDWVIFISFSLSVISFFFSFQNDYMPPDFLPLLQVIVSNIGDDESESSILFQLLSSIMEAGDEKVAVHIPHIVPALVGSVSKWLTANLEPWPQVCVDLSCFFLLFNSHLCWMFHQRFQSHNNILNLVMLNVYNFVSRFCRDILF